MLEIEQLLNSSCVGGLGYSPVQAGSANSITFVASQADNPQFRHRSTRSI